jgi:hypothetical protein
VGPRKIARSAAFDENILVVTFALGERCDQRHRWSSKDVRAPLFALIGLAASIAVHEAALPLGVPDPQRRVGVEAER